MSIGRLARELGISARAIRFYEARGLIRPARHGTVRTFGTAEHRRLALILRAKNLGLSLEEIGEHLALHDPAASDAQPLAELKHRAERQIAVLAAKQADLTATLKELRRIRADLAQRLARAKAAGT